MVAIHVLYEVVVTIVIITIVAEAVYRGYAVGYLPHRYRNRIETKQSRGTPHATRIARRHPTHGMTVDVITPPN